MLTMERFEHEMQKIKQQVGPDYYAPVDSQCIIGRMMENIGCVNQALRFRPHCIWVAVDQRCDAIVIMETISRAMNMNDTRYRWHAIVDALFPPAEPKSEPKAEPAEPAVPEVVEEELVTV